jgi:hypothetical protein
LARALGLPVEDGLILRALERDAGGAQAFLDVVIALLGRRFVVAVGDHPAYPQFCRQCRDLAAGRAVPNDQAAAPGAQGGVQFVQRGVNEVDAPVLAGRQGIEDFAIEHENAVNDGRVL